MPGLMHVAGGESPGLKKEESPGWRPPVRVKVLNPVRIGRLLCAMLLSLSLKKM